MKLIAAMLCLQLIGCSSVWNNMSFFNQQCNYVPPIVDTVGAAGLGGMIVVLSEGNNIHLSDNNKRDLAIASGIIAAILSISAYIGYLNAYHKCEEKLNGID